MKLKLTPELAEETGLHVGDGSMNYYSNKGLYQLRGHKIDDFNHYNGRIKYLYKKIYNIDIKLRDLGDVIGFQLWSNNLVNFKINLGLPLGPKVELRIPSDFFLSSKLLKAFIRGVFDTDGCLYYENKRGKIYPRIEISTTSNLLASDILFVLLVEGFRVRKHKMKRNTLKWRPLYRIALNGWEMFEMWFKEIKPMNPKHIEKYKKIKNLRNNGGSEGI